ncbi:hypothetical protein D1BOALGB6SA_3635 [Olavius sp. associated proteobacterium Delta 1]|nr:hypothetical protein D1BOALGB6SA_3635 [Olavius sp. associated proteobacterium Delta 1]
MNVPPQADRIEGILSILKKTEHRDSILRNSVVRCLIKLGYHAGGI